MSMPDGVLLRVYTIISTAMTVCEAIATEFTPEVRLRALQAAMADQPFAGEDETWNQIAAYCRGEESTFKERLDDLLGVNAELDLAMMGIEE